jgi:hypothetical protein
MSGTSSFDDRGSELIDEYLIAVENALIAAGAPRPDRMQVLQNLETQITEMLSPHPAPFTEDAVRSVLEKLEPPRHFAAAYINGSKRYHSVAPTPLSPQSSFRMARPNWPVLAAVSAGILASAIPFGLMTVASAPYVNDFWAILMLLSGFIGVVFTPIALWMAYRQLRSNPAAPGRGLVLNSAIVYGIIVPILIVLLAAEATDGAAPMLFGIAAFFYTQYVLLRRLWNRLSAALPAPPSESTTDSGNRNVPSSAHPATPMPAL